MHFSNEKKIYAGIVTYNPEPSRLFENINAVYPQVDKVIVIDNGSNNRNEIHKIINHFHNVYAIQNNENKGIAKALNQIMEAGMAEGAQWVLTLDQDSVVSQSLVSQYRFYLDMPELGMLSCILKDRNAKGITITKTHGEYEEIERCITSGCLTNVEAWDKCGRYDEKMFIDFVDFDLCMSLREHSYKIIRLNVVGLLHELGRSKDVRFNGKDTVVFNHAPFRKYYIVRNRIYYTRKHSAIINLRREYKGIIKYVITALLYEPNKLANLCAMIRGVIDSRKLCRNIKCR